MVNHDTFNEHFEEWAPACIQLAYTYADAHDSLDRFWVITHFGAAVTPYAVYEVNGRIYEPHDLNDEVADLDCSPEAQDEHLLKPLRENAGELRDAVVEADESLPTRIVLRFDVADDDVKEDVIYEPLEPGVPEDEQNPASVLHTRWVERLRESGNDAAAA